MCDSVGASSSCPASFFSHPPLTSPKGDLLLEPLPEAGWSFVSPGCLAGDTANEIAVPPSSVVDATTRAYEELMTEGLLPDGCQQHFTFLRCAAMRAHKRVSFTRLEMGVWKGSMEEVEEKEE